MDNEEKIYNFLRSQGFNDYGACGILGNIHAESACNPKNLQNTGNKKLGMTDDEYTKAVDTCKYTNFVRDSIGYGLCQWTYWTRKQALLDLAKAQEKSIGNIELQLTYLLRELKAYGLLTLKTATSIDEATRVFMCQFERPANQSEANIQVRIGYSNEYYKRFCTGKSQLETDINTLMKYGVISSPMYWQMNATKMQYLPELIHNMAAFCEGK